MYSEPVSFVATWQEGADSCTLGNVNCLPPPHASHPRICSLLEMIFEASYMKEAMETMPETLEYGIINGHVLHFLRDVICQVNVGSGRNLSVPKIKATWSPYSTSRQLAALTSQALS